MSVSASVLSHLHRRSPRGTPTGASSWVWGLGQPWPKPQKHYHPGERLRSSKKSVVPNHSLDVRYWHIADLPLALTNVRYRG